MRMASREPSTSEADDERPDDDPFARLEKTLNQILCEIQKLSRDDNREQIEEVEEYESCIRIRGRPILPPIMTPDRRRECVQWKREALEVETRLAEQRRRKILKALEVTQESEEEVFVMRTDTADDKVKTAFKNLISRLKENSDEKDADREPSSPQFESLSSEATVVEKTFPFDSDDNIDVSRIDLRGRKGSYSLDQPSPSLLAYMKRTGKSTMETPRPRSVLSFRPPTREAPHHLDTYLSELSQMPKIKIPANKVDTPVVNPPTPFRNSSSSRNEKFPKLNFESDSSDISSDEMSPQSVVSPFTAPTFPSVFLPPESISQATFTDAVNLSESVDQSSQVNQPDPNMDQTFPDDSTARTRTDPPVTSRSNINHDISLASSLQESVTIQTIGSVKNQVSTPNSKVDEGKRLEAAVCSLALRQEAEIRKLLEQQEREREQLKRMFDEQRRQLIEEIMSQVRSSQQTSISSTSTLRPPTSQTVTSPGTSTALGRSSPIIPTCVNKFRPPEECLKQLPQDYRVPDVVFTPQMKCRFDRLSALVKGYLTRRLLKTERVQRIISSMRDTMTIALQLHREAKTFIQGKGNVSVQDIELHRRLLQQIFKDSQSIHNIFFNIPTAQRMSIIRQDREIRQERSLRGEDPDPPKRISAVTKARMQQRTQIQAMLIRSEAAAKTYSPKKVTRSQERPWRQKPSVDSPSKPKGVRSSTAVGARRSLNLNENRPMTRTESVMSATTNNRKSRPSSTSSSSALTLHNKPWK